MAGGSRKGKRATKLPARLQDFQLGKNVPSRTGGTPIDSAVLNLPRGRRRTRNVAPLSSASSQNSGRVTRRPVFGPQNAPGPSGSHVRNLFNATTNTFYSPTSSVSSLPSVSAPVRNTAPSAARQVRNSPPASVISSRASRGRGRVLPFVRNPAAVQDRGARLVSNTPVPDPQLPRPGYNRRIAKSLKRRFVAEREYVRNPIEIRYDQNSVPHAVIRNNLIYRKIPSNYYPSNNPSNSIPLVGAFKSKNKILRRLKSLKLLKEQALSAEVRRQISEQIRQYIDKYNTYDVERERANSGFPSIESEAQIPN